MAHADGGPGAAGQVGSFEIDGNSADDSGGGEPIDWNSPPPNLTPFTDLSKNKNDNSFGQGSKELEPGTWVCTTGTAPGKDDLVRGAVAFREVGGDQFVYGRWQRLSTNGDAHIDYEFNQSEVANPACPAHPMRTDGDLLISFDTENGGATIIVRAFEWEFTNAAKTIGVFNQLSVGSKHTTWDGAVNIAPEKTDSGIAAGAFGELAVNLSDTIGEVECGQFASAFMKTRASTSISSALKDRTTNEELILGLCPELSADKTADSDSVVAGDPIGFTIEVSNAAGAGPAEGVTITDALPGSEAFGINWAIDPAYAGPGTCQITGSPPTETLSCDIGTLAAGQSASVHVTSSTSVPTGTCAAALLENTAVVDADNHDEVTATDSIVVECPAALNTIKVADADPVNVGDQIGFSITVSNSPDGGKATNVTLTDALPGSLSLGIDWSIAPAYAGPGTCQITGAPPTETLACSFGDLAPGASATVRVVSATSFPAAGCSDTTLTNTATVDADNHAQQQSTDTITVKCPDLDISKTADEATVEAGDPLGFTITVSNGGSGTAMGVTLTDALPGGTAYGIDWSINPAYAGPGTCGITGTPPAETLQCAFGNLGSGESATVHIVSATIAPDDCNERTLSNTAEAAATNHPKVQATATIELLCPPPACVPGQPDPSTAAASGSTIGAEVDDRDPLVMQHVHVGHMATSQTGVGADADEDQVAIVNLAGGTATARALHTSSSSTVGAAPPEAVQLTMSRGVEVGVLCDPANPHDLDSCEVSFEAGYAVARATAGPDGASISSLGTVLANAQRNGVPLGEIAPNTTIDVSDVFGPGSKIVLYETEGSTGFVPNDPLNPLAGGRHTASMRVALVRVFLADKLPAVPGIQGPLDVRVVQSRAMASFDEPTSCPPGPDTKSVSGHAMIASLTDPLLAPDPRVVVGRVDLDPSGGHEATTVGSGTVLDGSGNALLTYSAASTDTQGSTSPSGSPRTESASLAEIADVCIQVPPGPGCLVLAELLRSQTDSTARKAGASPRATSSDSGTVALNLDVDPVGAFGDTPPANTVVMLPGGLGVIVLNEQVCDSAEAVPDCAAEAHTGLTVRAVHVMLMGGIDLIVSEAHSDATYL